MAHVEQFKGGSNQLMPSTLSERLAAEGDLLSSIPNGAASAVAERWRQAQQNPQQLASEVGAAVVFGCAAGIITRNPAILGENLAPALAALGNYGGKALLGATMVDLASRVAVPVVDTWNGTADSKELLGRNLGNAVVDYGISGIAGGAGFAAGTRAAALIKPALIIDAQNRVCFATATGHLPAERRQPSLQFDDLVAKSVRANPSRVMVSGKVVEAKNQNAHVGDVFLGSYETKNREAVGFLPFVKLGDYHWGRLDTYAARIHALVYAMNEFQLNLRRPDCASLIAAQAGRHASLIETLYGPRYKFESGPFMPKELFVPARPSIINIASDIYTGRLRPMHDAQSVPARGAIWLKFDDRADVPRYFNRKPVVIRPRVSTGYEWAELRTTQFGNLEFESVRAAEEKAASLKAQLRDRPDQELFLIGPNGKPAYRL